ncbi:MAG: glucosaminidase domain-containing protein [Dysgonamonadaceae bacterium]|nr:glucosaminidase domain-containing protein [Dysgonamonadaceae bacterium]
MNRVKKIFPVACLMCGMFFNMQAQRNRAYVDYIDRYKHIAIREMNQYKIPASIKLSQALLESGAGKSSLATESNNHFGIKCHAWTGQKVRHDDDEPGECFRKYSSAEASYRDHSEFLLKNRNRYGSLFQLPLNDYKAWAKGLQKAGYATNREYANRLIKLIEMYEIYRFDSGILRRTWISRGLLYVEAEDGDSFEKIAADLRFNTKKLLKYNDAPKGHRLRKGDPVYLQKKKKRLDKAGSYTVRRGDSMHNISQRFGITISSLYRINKKSASYSPAVGDVLKFR